MTAKLSDIEKMVLSECVAREKQIAATPKPPEHRRWDLREWEELRDYGPAYSSGEWFGDERGHLPEKIRSRILRAIRELERRGFIVCTNNGSRLGWMKTTDEGRAALEGGAS